jgi:uncharacterized protein (DUF362 family)
MIRRRDFLRTAGTGLAALPFLDIGRLAGTGAARSRIAVVRTADRKAGIRAALALLDPQGIAGRHVVLKPNFNTADPAPASTHQDTLTQLVAELQERGARRITLGESSGPPATRDVMARKGVFDLARDLRFDVVNFDELPDEGWAAIPAEGTHWPEGFHIPRLVLDAEYLVSTCCLKTHAYGGVFTMALKLSVGLTPKSIRRTMHRSPHMRRMIAELNRPRRPDLIVLDGVDAFTDGGPSDGTRARAEVIIAGGDPVAIDAVGVAMLKHLGSTAAIMEHPIFRQDQIAHAAAIGLGAPSPAAIQLVTPDAASATLARSLRSLLDQT